MSRRLRPVARLIIAVLLLQVVLAPAHCLAMAAPPAGLEAVICSPDGMMRTMHLGPDGQEMPAHEPGSGFCLACPALPQAALPSPPVLPAPAWAAAIPAWHATSPDRLPPPARGPPFAPRAPPAFG